MSCDIMLRMMPPALATLASSALSCYATKLEKLAVTAQESYDNRTKGFLFLLVFAVAEHALHGLPAKSSTFYPGRHVSDVCKRCCFV